MTTTCEHDHDDDADRECGEPATHSGYVPMVAGRVAVCERHGRAAQGRGDLLQVNPREAT